MDQDISRLTLDRPAVYRIRVQGWLDATWSDYVAGMEITTSSTMQGAPITTLTGKLPDQAALSGVLNHLYDLGLPLLAVELDEHA